MTPPDWAAVRQAMDRAITGVGELFDGARRAFEHEPGSRSESSTSTELEQARQLIKEQAERIEKLRWLESLDRQHDALPPDAVDLLWYAATQSPDTRPSDAVRARMELLLSRWRRPAPVMTSGGVELTEERIAQLAAEAERGYDVATDDEDPDPALYEAFRRGLRFHRAAEQRIDASGAAAGTADVTIGHDTDDDSHDGPLYALLPVDWPRIIHRMIKDWDVKPLNWRDELEDALLTTIDDWVADVDRYDHEQARLTHERLQRATGAAPAAYDEPCG
jgi:hypothetical protein